MDEYIDGQTPLNEEEKEQLLISSISTQGELNEFEQLNIQKAVEWSIRKKISKENIFSEEFVRDLHRKMFDEVWKWAGHFRHSEKNIGIDPAQIGSSLNQLNGNCNLWVEKKIYPDEEIAILYKHKLVSIHCFPNGNGRHSRLMADVIINHIFEKKVFTWSRSNIVKKGESRTHYLSALKEADNGNIQPLIEFANS